MSASNARQRVSRFLFSATGGSIGFLLFIWLTAEEAGWPSLWYIAIVAGTLAAVPSLVTDSFHDRLRTPMSARGTWLALSGTAAATVLLFWGLLTFIQ